MTSHANRLPSMNVLSRHVARTRFQHAANFATGVLIGAIVVLAVWLVLG